MKNALAIIAALLALTAGCKQPASGPNTVTAGSGGRNVEAVVYGPVWVKPDADRFIVTLPGHELVFEKERLLVDKKEAANFPAAATNFAVAYSNGALRVTADSAEVLDSRL
jgi:hypothetical protein